MTDSTTRIDRAPAAYDPSVETYDQRMDAARAALASGDRATAELSLEAAIAIAERTTDGTSALAVGLARLGELKHLDGKEAEAERLFRRALELNERVLGQEHPDLVVLLNDLSRLYLKRGAYVDAEPLLLRLHAIKRTKGEDHPEVATVLASLASVKQALGRYDGAEQLWRRVLEIRERTLAPHHFSIATALEHLGETCAARGKLNEALRHRLRALAMREMTLDPGHPSLRTARERIADLQLQASEEALGTDAPDADYQAPVWRPPVSPALMNAAPVAPARAPAEPPAPQAQPVPYAAPRRAAPAPALLADDELLDDDPGRRDVADSGGLHLVNVAGVGDASRSVIMPYYADALALAEEAADAEDLSGRQAGGFASGTAAFLRGRQAAIMAGIGAGVLILGAVGAKSFARTPGDDDAAGAGRSLPAAASAVIPEPARTVADSVTAAGSIDPSFAAGERVAERSGERSRVPDEPTAALSTSRSAGEATRAAAPELPPAGAMPRTLNVSVNPMPQAPAAGTNEPLAAKVTLPTGSRLRSVTSAGETESQPALLIVAPTPVYPASLYTKGVAGAAAVEFVVDVNGRVDLSTFKSKANHELFTEAVLRIMPGMRFVPSIRDGRKVPTPMRMRFEFSKSGVSSSKSD